MPVLRTSTAKGRARLAAVGALAAPLALVAAPPGPGWAAAGSTAVPFTPYSGIAAPQHGPNAAHGPAGSALLTGVTHFGSVTVGHNVNAVPPGNDTIQQETIDGVQVKTCNPGKPTAQNETSVAVDPSGGTLVGGANDYRLYEPSEDRYDGSGGVYTSSDGGSTWTDGFLPDLVRANPAAPGPYEAAGDPSVSAGPDHTFWYGNLAFNRSDDANAVAVSRSGDDGATWTTNFVTETSAAGGATLFNDKDWVAADPTNPDVAYATWTQFHTNVRGIVQSSPIVISKGTFDPASDKTTWSAPVPIVPAALDQDQGSTVVVAGDGTVYVTFEVFRYHGHDWAAEATLPPGEAATVKLLAVINDIPSPLPVTGDAFRTDSLPTFAVAGSNQYVAWSNWNGTDADIVLLVSHDSGASWSGPVTLAGGPGNQFFPWLSASGGDVAAVWYDDGGLANSYNDVGSLSSNDGSTWAGPATISSAPSDVAHGNLFGYPNCSADFIGDYNGVTLDSTGTAHALWTDIRDQKRAIATNQNPYTATLTSP